ncbi:MAG: DNA adenine methylase [Phycisphaerae bacterium]|nr:DNA adenine methylase [Phycisphaerae bacterium]
MRIRNVPQPFPYQGSKRKLASVILSCIPKGTRRLLEPFAGSAAISVAAAWNGVAETFWLNDAHQPLISLWNCILTSPLALADDYERIWTEQLGREKEYYNLVRNKFNRTQQPADFLFLLARCVKAAIRYNRNGEFNNSPDHRRLGMKPDTMRNNIILVHKVLCDRTTVSTSDFKAVLRKTKKTDFVYMDPPYQGVCRNRDNRYVKGIVFDEFVEELNALNAKQIPFVVSYDGRTGDTTYGEKLPESLNLFHCEILVGRSTQATLLGRSHNTYESLYLSPAAIEKLKTIPLPLRKTRQRTCTLFD